MFDQETQAEFILLRAQGYNYEEIGQILKVSKPTLIKWNRNLEENIKKANIRIMEELVSKIFQKNKDRILNDFDILDKTIDPKPEYKEAAQKTKSMKLKKMEDLFRIKISSVTFGFGKNRDLLEVSIKCK